jgi:hypothetical protein
MQGRGDRRSSKSDIRPEHNNSRYLDSVVETAVEFFSPYKDVIKLFGYGNHEKGIQKWQETDLLRRFVDLFNYKNKTEVYTGGYGGFIKYKLMADSATKIALVHKYFHGSGGGGIVTKGAINLTRMLEMAEGFDIFSMGHIHENMARNDVREYLYTNADICEQRMKEIHLAITGTYKEEFGDGSTGWHVERGAPPKPIGGRILEISAKRVAKQTDGLRERVVITSCDSYKFPIL